MKISLVSETYFPQINGVSRTLGRLVDYLNRQGDSIQLITPAYPQGNEGSPVACQISVPSFPMPFYPEIRFCRTTTRTIAKHLTKFKPDIVHIATEGPLGWTARRAVRRKGIPLATSYHTNFADYLSHYHAGFLTPFAWRYLRNFHNGASITFCPSNSTREILLSKGFQNVTVWGRGVQTNCFGPAFHSDKFRQDLGLSSNDKLLLYVGRIASEKNLETLLNAFNRLPESLSCKLALIGDGPARHQLEHTAGPNVLFPGYKRGAELAKAYASADLFIFPSLTDTFGNVILEAMASGVPVLGFNVPGPRDIIRHNNTGWIIPDTNPETLANSITTILSQHHSLKQAGQAARDYACSQTWDNINSVVRNGYLNLLT